MASNWIYLAIGSGLAAGLNGLFAKLVTTTLTTSFASAIARVFSLPEDEKVVEYIVRGLFFGLNLLFNAIMWGLFTAALAKGSSATKVSIVNTSSNFMITAILGWLVFSESLPGTWWLGASLLVAGNVVIGMRDDGSAASAGYEAVGTEEPEEEELQSRRNSESESESESEESRAPR
ncbi:uncharacterized protein H6S33_001565 [Morchella sextelata]|uniref:uncharacterized protein n=1 Tax=Morchella sextelata TaxID=1174677 RepID=UPI001D04C24B|nr:uncharacterized protein H6S33_001565 [Morchella sextelata]KAH0608431.1 hypothetical protein H6S33_001565 [Morchella sextelata]